MRVSVSEAAGRHSWVVALMIGIARRTTLALAGAHVLSEEVKVASVELALQGTIYDKVKSCTK